MKRLFLCILTVCLCFCLPMTAMAEEDAGGLIYNGDFSAVADDADMPAGWQWIAYDDSLSQGWVAPDEDGNNMIVLESDSDNDVRACQDVEVDPDTTYRVKADICTESAVEGYGASLSVDNYSIDGTYCYTDGLLGDNDWQTVELYVHTGEDQTLLRIALRLGGYGQTSSGYAGFRNVSMEESEYEGKDVIYLDETFSQSGSSTGSLVNEGNGLISLIVAFAAVALLLALVYWLMMTFGLDKENGSISGHATLAAVLAGTFVLRLVLSLIFYGHSTDINCFMAWGNAALNNGLSTFYTSGMFADYPPGYMYICALMSWLSKLFGFGYGTAGMAFMFKLPSTVADTVTAYLLYRLALKNGLSRRMSLIMAALVAFNPVVAFVSGAWGQIESLLVLGIALSFYFLQQDKPITCGAVYGLTILLKPQALMFGPILAVSYFCHIRYAQKPLKQALKTLLAVVAACFTLFAVSFPFKGEQEPLWLIHKYFSTSTSYPYASIEAFNFPALLGDNWASVKSTVLGIPYTVWGPIMIGLGILIASVIHIFSFTEHSEKGNPITVRKGSLYLTAACMMTFLFTFGYYMHERYLIPVLLLLLIAYVYEKDRRILLAFTGLSAAAFLNAIAAMFIVDYAELRNSLYEGITRFGGFLETLCCLYLLWICVDILLLGNVKREGFAHPQMFVPSDGNFVSLKEINDNKKGVNSKGSEILRLEDKDSAKRLNRTDRWLLLGLTAIYAVCALLNLGSLSAPETNWQTETPGDYVTVSFGEETDVDTLLVFGNLAESGTLLIETEEGESELYEQTYDNMFRWDELTLGFTTATVTVSLYSGEININEIAFKDGDGNLIPAEITACSAGGENLLDEQDTVPGEPSYYNGMYFDELYHARTAYEHLNNLEPYENSHPPLGKIIISIGIALFGMCPFGWRIMGTLFGIAMVPVMYIFGKRLLKDTKYAFLAAALFAFDFMHFTQTRIATIDVYAVFFILLMYLFMYEYITMNFFTDGLKKTLLPLALCGVSFGLGIACKWISAYAGAGLAVLFFGSLLERWGEYASAMRGIKGGYGSVKNTILKWLGHGNDRPATKKELNEFSAFGKNTVLTLAWCCLFFLLVPFTVYFLSYIPYFRYEASIYGSYTLKDAFETFGRYQTFMFNYHSGLTATHPYQSSWWQWPFTLRPMWYYSGTDYSEGIVSTLTASGNPAVWWVSAVGAVLLLIERILKRVEKDRGLRILCVGVLANYLPWVLVTRCTFIYHFFATVPFILFATVYLLKQLEKRYPFLKPLKWIWLGIALLLFILLYPGISGLPIDADWAAFIKQLPGGGLMYGA